MFAFSCRYIRFDDSVARRTPAQYRGDGAQHQVQASTDRLSLIRIVSDRLQKNFVEKYRPGKYLTVDERMINYRGRCSFIVYMKDKPDPYGIKIWAICDAATSYFLYFDVYAGQYNENI